MKFPIIILALTLVLYPPAKGSLLNRKAAKTIDAIFDLGLSAPEACDELSVITDVIDENTLFTQGIDLYSRYQFCDAAERFYSIYSSNPRSELAIKSLKALAKSYTQVFEYVFAINQINIFLKNNAELSPAVQEELRFEILLLVEMATKNDKLKERKSWLLRSMGVSEEQTKDQPFLQNLIYSKFLDQYPNSPRRAPVEQMHALARKELSETLLKEGRNFRLERDYQKSVAKFKIILRWGKLNPYFFTAIEETKLTLEVFAYELRDEKLMSNVLLAQILGKKVYEITPQARIELAEEAEKNWQELSRL